MKVNEFVVTKKEDAELVLKLLVEIIENYSVIALADYKELLGLETVHLDNVYGWTQLNNVNILKLQEGYLIDLPPLEEI
jgi:hypothetical protein